MSTVDDLVISLTIKPSSDLGRLQKQLDSLVGKRGRGIGSGMMFIKRDLNDLKRSTNLIFNRLKFLVPITTPTVSPGLRKVGISHAKAAERYREGIKDAFLQMRPSDYEKFLKGLGISTEEEARKILDRVVDDLIGMGEDIFFKGRAKKQMEDFNDYMKKLLTNIGRTERNLGLGLFQGALTFGRESTFRDLIADALRNLGGKVSTEEQYQSAINLITGRPSRIDVQSMGAINEFLDLIEREDLKGELGKAETLWIEVKERLGKEAHAIIEIEKEVEKAKEKGFSFMVVAKHIVSGMKEWLSDAGIKWAEVIGEERFKEKVTGEVRVSPSERKELEKMAELTEKTTRSQLLKSLENIARLIENDTLETEKGNKMIEDLLEMAREAGIEFPESIIEKFMS